MLSELILEQVGTQGSVIEAIYFLSYILVCAALFKSRYSRFATVLAFGAAGIVITGVNAAIMLSGTENLLLMLTMLPLTAYLPFSVLLFFLSDSGMFETMAVCAFGTLEVLILKSLQKVLIGIYANPVMINTCVTLAAAGLVFIAFRFISGTFSLCVIENRQNRLILLIPIITVFLMMLWFLNSVDTPAMLIFTVLIALSIFFVIVRLLNLAAELIHARSSEREMSKYIDIQRQGYDRVVRKMEATREYRHDMRHHLAVIEGLAKQGECDKIVEYTSNLNGSFGKLENVDYCKNPEVNAVLSEYISHAESAGCRITHSFTLPQKLPFAENDVCLVLANAIENAIKACSELPKEKRRIKISAEYRDGHRLLISVENPCFHSIEFDENGLPVTNESLQRSPQDPYEHGIGLRSVKRITEKYNGFLRCMLEKGEFVFQAALFYDNGTPTDREKYTSSASTPKRVASSLLCLGLGALIMLNVLPSAAEAASALFSVNIRTVRNLDLVWGSNSVSADIPEFDENNELNSAVKNYADEAKEKFLWYFNRRYNGYVAEDMKYTVIRDDDKYFIAQFNVTVNAGGSMDYSRWTVFDKSKSKIIRLADMFKEGSDYIGVISAEILEQMKYKNEHEDSFFFVDGDDAFTEISEDANFYIDSFDRLVIVFDEYEVAPGSMGSPQFFIHRSVLEEILNDYSS